MNKRTWNMMLRAAVHKHHFEGIGDAAFYMRLHESMHPAHITSHIVKEAAKRIRDERHIDSLSTLD